jgi:hypothetical protein
MSRIIVPFGEAKPGQWAFVYDVSKLEWDVAWVAQTEYFDDLSEDITVKRQIWQLISEEEVTFPGYASRLDELAAWEAVEALDDPEEAT